MKAGEIPGAKQSQVDAMLEAPVLGNGPVKLKEKVCSDDSRCAGKGSVIFFAGNGVYPAGNTGKRLDRKNGAVIDFIPIQQSYVVMII